MHVENKAIDGFFELRQNVCNFRIGVYSFGELIRTIQPGRLLTIEELHEMLLKERAEIGGISDDE